MTKSPTITPPSHPAQTKVERLYKAGLNSLLAMGLARAVLVATIVSILLSLLVCGTAIYVTMPQTMLEEWVYFAIITPAVVSPLVSLVIFKMAYELAETRAALANAASTDHLTGLANRRQFLESAERDVALARRRQSPAALVMMDIDHFKALNDRFGHAGGDAVLVAISAACNARLRQTDLLCRWGGEEFIVLLPMCGLEDAVRVAENLRRTVETTQVDGIDTMITMSLGATEITLGEPLDNAIAKADEQLYRAKAAGRNQVQPPLGLLASPA